MPSSTISKTRKSRSHALTALKRGNMAIRFEHHRNWYHTTNTKLKHYSQTLTTSRPHVARVSWHRCPGILHHLLRHCTQRRNRRNPPRTLPSPRPSIMGFLGLIHRHRLSRHLGSILVRNPKHERRQRSQVHDRSNLAIIPDDAQRYSRVPGHRDKHDG